MLRVLLLLLSLLVLVAAAYAVDLATSTVEYVAIAVNSTGVARVGSDLPRTVSPFLRGTLLMVGIGVVAAIIVLLLTGIVGEEEAMVGGGGVYVSG